MKKIMTIMMLSCKKACALIVKKEDFNLKRIEKMQLFFHTLVCSACHRFEAQNKIISKALKHHVREPEQESGRAVASEQLQEKIFSKLEEMK